MGYNVSFDGKTIDNLLNKSQLFSTHNSSWIKLQSTDQALRIENLLRSGNYAYTGKIAFPEMEQVYGINTSSNQSAITKDCSCMIFVRPVNRNIYQYYHMTSLNESSIDTMIIAWILQKDFTYIPKVFYNNETSNIMLTMIDNDNTDAGKHKFNNQIRIVKDNGTIKYYDAVTKEYKLFINDAMDSIIYGSISNVFQYIDDYVPNINYAEHLNNSNIHITVSEKEALDLSMTTDKLTESIESWKSGFIASLQVKVNEIKSILQSANIIMGQLQNAVPEHQIDSVKHPSKESTLRWNNKADGSHTHTKDQIAVDVSNVIGKLTMDVLPDSVKERQVTVTSTEDMLKLTNLQVHTGSWILVKTDNRNLYYVVIDDTKLGTMNAFTLLSSNVLSAMWSDIQNKPLAINQLITNALSNRDVDTLKSNLDNKVSTTGETVTELSNTYQYSNLKYCEMASSIESLIDLINYKIQIVTNLITNS